MNLKRTFLNKRKYSFKLLTEKITFSGEGNLFENDSLTSI